jgi:hypothetical protein
LSKIPPFRRGRERARARVSETLPQHPKSTRPRRSGAQIALKYSREPSDVKAAGLRRWGVQFPFSLAISHGLSYSGVTAESDFRRSIGVLDFRQGLGISLFPSEPSVHTIVARTVRPFPCLPGLRPSIQRCTISSG